MSALQIIRDVESHGGKIYLLDGTLKMASRRGTIPPHLLAELKSHKGEIISILTGCNIKNQFIDEPTSCWPKGAHQLRTLEEPPIDKLRHQVSPIALKWLQDHRQELRQFGWTGRELYRRNKSKGLMWMGIWEQASLGITIQNNGVIVFQFQTATGQPITQTARPIKQKPRG